MNNKLTKLGLLSLFILPLMGACSWGDHFSIELPSEESSTRRELLYIEYHDTNTFHIGDSYALKNDITLTSVYSDGSTVSLDGCNLSSLGSLNDSLDRSYKAKTPFEVAGWYTSINAKAKTPDGYQFTDVQLSFYVNSGIEDNYELDDLTIDYKATHTVGELLEDNLDTLNIYATWKDRGVELLPYSRNKEHFSLSLYANGNLSKNVINEPLKAETNYTLEVSYKSYKAIHQFGIVNGVQYVKAEDLSFTAKDVNLNYAPSKGDVKMLVIPITLPDDTCTDVWTDDKVDLLNNLYFGEDGSRLSLKQYYEVASFKQMNVSGLVAKPYVEEDHRYDVLRLQADDSMGLLFELIARAVSYIEESNSNIDWSKFDVNNDGCLDNVHLITNFDTSAYSKRYGDVWATPLWPHMYQTNNNSGTPSRPVANVYSISAIDHVRSAITAIHEQGHIFGLNDYYDYSYAGVDYVGSYDMQDQNCFDWNSYSKLVTGWVSPYVIDGSANEVEVTIKAASTSGDCIIIPADYSTWNGSAYDEYFLIELFSNGGVNSLWWDYYDMPYGIRLYHVDSRLWDYEDMKEVDYPNGHKCDVGTNNCYNYQDYDYGCYEWKDYPLLALIQQGAKNTFGTGERTTLRANDLFRTGNQFKFEKYSHFLNKKCLPQTSMNNGETFPYTIDFIDVNEKSATISFKK